MVKKTIKNICRSDSTMNSQHEGYIMKLCWRPDLAAEPEVWFKPSQRERERAFYWHYPQ